MTRRLDDEWDEGEWEEDPEGPSVEDRRRFSSETTSCPGCRAEIHDESLSCPRCGHWVEDSPAGSRGPAGGSRLMAVVLAVLLAGGAGVVFWLLRR